MVDMENKQSYVIITGGKNTPTHLLIFNTTSDFKEADGKFTANSMPICIIECNLWS